MNGARVKGIFLNEANFQLLFRTSSYTVAVFFSAMSRKNVLLCFSGSVATIKAPLLLEELRKQHEVKRKKIKKTDIQ